MHAAPRHVPIPAPAWAPAVLKTGERITETDSFVVHTEDGKKVGHPLVWQGSRVPLSLAMRIRCHASTCACDRLARTRVAQLVWERQRIWDRLACRFMKTCAMQPARLLKWRSKKVILATGVRDLIPDIKGFKTCEQAACL